jgi:hypothetical protein
MSGAFPSNLIRTEIPGSEHVTLVSTAQSLKQQTRSKPGHRWTFDLETTVLSQADWRDLFGFLAVQRGEYDTFTYTPVIWATPRGAGGGTPLVDGSSQAGRTVVTDGWPATTAILKRGDVLKFANHAKVYMVTSDVTSSSSGAASLSIEPALFSAPADNEAITIDNVPLTVALKSNLQQISVDVAMLGQTTVQIVERS